MSMAKKEQSLSKRSLRPAMSPEARELQLISLAIDQAEQQLIDGTASSSVICHFLKLGSSKDRLEKERLESENRLLQAKIDKLASDSRVEDLYKDAIDAMKRYTGREESYDTDEDVF